MAEFKVPHPCIDCSEPVPCKRPRCTPCTLKRWDVTPPEPVKVVTTPVPQPFPPFVLAMFLGGLR